MKRILGAVALASAGTLFFVGQWVVQSAWTEPFSWADNNISDLGEVSAPWHRLMNTVFVLNGALVATGAVTLFRGAVRYLLLAAAVGCVLVGLAPADVDENTHVLGAALVFVLGNLGLIATRRRLGVVFGIVGLIATGLHVTGHGLGIGVAGMERVAVYPLFLWFLIEGVARLRKNTVREGS
ncbi:DUF998 domain-containing protein [Cryptosporangium japonicum]|uniref:DUF998 domain-containing protein n=1 Tax=Cryptosporangium japonicum TaxID=80872 RepID=A0ABN0U9L4_9ACTN